LEDLVVDERQILSWTSTKLGMMTCNEFV
jgi:hypothetical protein